MIDKLITLEGVMTSKIDHSIDFSKPNRKGLLYDKESYIQAVADHMIDNNGLYPLIIKPIKKDTLDESDVVGVVINVDGTLYEKPYLTIGAIDDKLSRYVGWDLYAMPKMDTYVENGIIYVEKFYYWYLSGICNWKRLGGEMINDQIIE